MPTVWRKPLDAALVVGPRLLEVVFGLWFMVMPALVGYSQTLAGMNDRVIGPLLVGFGFLALWPALRFLRWAELVVAPWIFITPLFIRYEIDDNTLPEIVHVCIPLILVGTVFLGGKTAKRLGGGWGYVLPFLKREVREEL